jgi:hypothetical protein
MLVRLDEVARSVNPEPRPGFFARLFRRAKAHRERADRFDARLSEALDTVIERTMAAPTAAVLEDWAKARAALTGVAG